MAEGPRPDTQARQLINTDTNSLDRRLLRTIYLSLMLVIVSVIGLWLLVKLQSILVLVFVAVLIATSMAGPLRRLQAWGLPRAASILTMFLGTALVVAGMLWFTLPPLIGQLAEAAETFPDRFDQFQRLQQRFDDLEQEYPILQRVEDRAADSVSDVLSSLTTAIVSLPALLTLVIFVVTSLITLSFLMLTSWETIKSAALPLIHPDHRDQTLFVLQRMGERLGAYVRAKVIIVTIVAVWMYVALLLLGSPIALLVAMITGFFEIIPRIGPLIARALIVLAVLPLGWRVVVLAFVAHLIIDNIKGSWLSPLIEGHQVDVHPLTAFLAVLIGAVLMGWMGALIAVPTAAVVQVMVEEVLVPWRMRQLGMAEKVPPRPNSQPPAPLA